MVRPKIDARELSEVLDRSAVVPLCRRKRIGENRRDHTLSVYDEFAAPSISPPSSRFRSNNVNPFIAGGVFVESTIGLILRWRRVAQVTATIVERFQWISVINLNPRICDAKDKAVHLYKYWFLIDPHRPHGIVNFLAVFPQRPFSSPSRHTDAL